MKELPDKNPGYISKANCQPSIAALLPLKVTGRHYGENLARLDLLFSSLLFYAGQDFLDEIIIVTPEDEVRLVNSYVANWPELPIRTVSERGHFNAFERYNKPWQIRPWQRQQIIKLSAPLFTTADYILTLDPDVLLRRQVTRDLLTPDSRALLQPEPRRVHAQWWRDSAALLGVPAEPDSPGMGVTPALLAREVLLGVHRALSERGGQPWMDVLLSSYSNWTEYTLYLLTAEQLGVIDKYHYWCAENTRAIIAPLQVATNVSVWDGGPRHRRGDDSFMRNRVDQIFTSADPGMFAVIQSNTDLSATWLASIASDHFTVRRTSVYAAQKPRNSSKLKEVGRTAARLVASGVYRLRR